MDLKRTEELKAIAAKIRALLGKTTENGCTESEALLAASKAQQLMEKYQLSLTETELRAEEITRDFRPSAGRIDDAVRNAMCMAIAEFTDTRVYLVNQYIHGLGSRKCTAYVGLESDTQFARWLHDSLADFCDRGAKRAKRDGMDRRSFALGAAFRIAERLRELARARKQAAAQYKGTGTDLVIVTKANMVQKYMDDVVGKLRKNYSKRAGVNGDSFHAGRTYGNGATFSRPVNGRGAVARIGN